MSALIRMQVVRLLRDAVDELREHPDALTPRELAGLGALAVMYERPELASNLARLSFGRFLAESESRG